MSKINNLISLIKNKLPIKMISRKVKIPIENKLEGIIYVLRTGISWKDLGMIHNVDEGNYRKLFYKLTEMKIFDKIIKEIKEDSEITFIDSSVIVNKCGNKESIGYCPQNKKHKGNKVSLIINDKGKPSGYSVDKSSCHDLKLVDKTIKDVNTKIIVGDKGYTSKDLQIKLEGKGIKMLVPYKKNSKNKNTIIEKELLKKRHLVENSFCNIKKLKRLGYRYEIKLKNFIGFVGLGLIWLMIT